MILLLLLVSVGSVPRTVNADELHVSVSPTSVPVGKSFMVTFWVEATGSQQWNGQETATVHIRPSGTSSDIWQSSPMKVGPGLDYEVYPPGISTPGTYEALVAITFHQMVGNVATFQVVGSTTPATDWAVLSVSLSPSAPKVGDPVTFSMAMTALTSPGSFPQSFSAVCELDGASCGGGSLTYPGPTGTPFTVSTQTPWIATPGTHTLTWGVGTIPVGLDPNTSNNAMSKSFTVAPQAQFDFSISASPPQQSVVPSSGATYGVTVNLVSGTAQSVALSLSTPPPAGVSVSLTPSSGTPPFSSTLSVTTTASASPGTFTLTVSGVGGGVSHSAPVTLIVTQAPDFQINVSPASQSVLQGQTVSYTVNVVGLKGFNSQVSLTVTGAPSGVNIVFSVPSATPNFVSTLTVTLLASAPTGSFTLAITGSGGGVSRLANAVLIINQATQTQSSSSSTQTSTASGVSDLMSMLQQNSLLILAVIILIVGAALVASRRRRTAGPAQAAQGARGGGVHCRSCGTQNPAGNEFCAHCGTKL